MKFHLRWMVRSDLPAVLAIEKQSFAQPWAEGDFLRCLRHRNCIGMVAECDGRIEGFVLCELHEGRLHLLNLAVHPDSRRSGIGAQLVGGIIARLTNQLRRKITACVSERNSAALAFFRSRGFRAVRVLWGYYPDSDSDAYLMEHTLPGVRQGMAAQDAVREGM